MPQTVKRGQDLKLIRQKKFTVREACVQLRISVRTMRRWIKAGKVRTLQPGHAHLITGEEIERVLLGQKVREFEDEPHAPRRNHEKELQLA